MVAKSVLGGDHWSFCVYDRRIFFGSVCGAAYLQEGFPAPGIRHNEVVLDRRP